MIIDGLHEKDIFTEKYPFRLVLNTEENFTWPSHWHHAVEFVFPVENSYTAVVSGQPYFLQEKDILFIPAGEIHSYNTRNNNGTRYFIQFDLSSLNAFSPVFNLTPYLSRAQLFTEKDDSLFRQELDNQLTAIICEYEEKAFAYTLALNARILDILVLLSRRVFARADTHSAAGCCKKVYSLERLNRAFQYIEDNYQQDISLKEAAFAASFSESHFSRVFKELTGQNFHDYLTSCRIKKAKSLLSSHDISIIDVAHMSGFSSISTFNRTFKKCTGCTPMEYKRMQMFI